MVATAAPHRVRRMALTVRGARDADAALAWRQALHEGAEGALRLLLDAALDRAAERNGLGAQTLHMPRLRLRVGAKTPEALVPALRAALDEALEAVARGAIDGGRDDGEAVAARVIAPTERATVLLRAYLASGRVPWHEDVADAAAVARALRGAAREAIEAWLAAPAQGARWFDAIPAGARRAAWRRWAGLLDAATVDRLRAAIDAHAQEAPSASGDAADTPATRGDADDASRGLALLLALGGQDTRRGAAPTPPAGAVDTRAPAVPVVEPLRVPAVRWPEPAAPVVALPTLPRDAAPADEAPATDRWWARDAGLVLLHPYLPTLLRTIGALDDAGRLRPERVSTAAALLHWLATGRDEAHEFELTLSKLLLGIALDAPLPPAAFAIDDALRAEGEALLDAAIAHWPALGHTSVEGLRRSFLARDGLLTRVDDGWHLRVADEPFDLLLGRLPWGIGLVRLPWMDAPVHVHWGTFGA